MTLVLKKSLGEQDVRDGGELVAAADSLDLAVDWAAGRRPRGLAYYSAVADAQRELSELLGVPVDIVPIEQAKPRLAALIAPQAPPL